MTDQINDLQLFDTYERDHMRPSGFSEPKWEYMNRSARPGFQYVRDVLQGWFDDFDATDVKRHQLWTEFRSSDNTKHLSAFFEIYLYKLFKSQDFEVRVEPEWENGKPDFMLTTSEGKKILLEATGIYPKRWFGPAKQQEDVLLDRLNEQLDLPDYFLHVKVEKAGSGNPPFGKIRSYLQNQLVQLDYDDVVKDAREQEGLGQKQFPSWIWDNDAWKLKFTVSPKKEEARGKPGHPVGSTSSGFEYVDVASSIKSAIKRKYRRYGELDLPYIFALNVVDPFADGYSLADALFGQEVINLNFDTGERSISRQPNGSWLGPKDWQKTRMSAICVFKRLRPVMMHTVSPTIWHHPFAKNPLLPEIFKLAQQIPNLSTGTYERRDGQHPVELLNLDITRMPS